MNGQTLVKAFVALPSGGKAVYTSSGLAYYRHSDHLGSSRLSTTPSRTKYYDVAYAPYGEDYAGSGTQDLSFTDQNQDTVSGGWSAGLYDFLFREYRPAQGRWTSPDPAGLAAVDPSNPQSWNRYAYVLNGPLNVVDPLGLVPPTICLIDGGCPPGGGAGGGMGDCTIVSIDYLVDGVYQGTDDYLNCPGGGGGGGVGGAGGGTPPGGGGGGGGGRGGAGATTQPPAANNGPKPCSASSSTTSIVSGNATTNIPTIAAGAAIGEAIGGPPGAFLGGIIGSFFGVGGTVSYVPSTKSLYAGPTVVFAPALGGGNGFSGNVVSVPAGQNPNSIANGLSGSVTFQPGPLLGSTVVKSPGSPPVVGPSVGTRIPVSFGASYNFPVIKGACQ